MSTATLLSAFLAALQPFSQMLLDIYRMLDAANAGDSEAAIIVAKTAIARSRPVPLAPRISAAELERHAGFVATELAKAAIWSWH